MQPCADGAWLARLWLASSWLNLSCLAAVKLFYINEAEMQCWLAGSKCLLKAAIKQLWPMAVCINVSYMASLGWPVCQKYVETHYK